MHEDGRRNGVFVLKLETGNDHMYGKRGLRAMDVGKVEEEGEAEGEGGEGIKFMSRLSKDDMAVFRRQAM